jgi:ABC-type transport system substrate-binding protein
MKKFILITAFLLLCVGALLWFFYDRSSLEHNSKNTIRVLIDRYPSRQFGDATYRKIEPLIREDHYELKEEPNHDFFWLIPGDPLKPTLEFQVMRDEITRAIQFLKGDADVLYDSLSLAKTEWVIHHLTDSNPPPFRVYRAPGLTLSFLGFNLKSEVLKDRSVREKIAHAIPLQDWIQYKLFNWVHPFALLNPYVDESVNTHFTLRYFTTPVREGNEQSQLVREALKKIGIDVEITTVDTALFYEQIQKGDFDLFSGRFFRFSKNEPIAELLGSNGKRNFFGYHSAKIDEMIRKNSQTSLEDVQPILEQDLPIAPLFTWDHGLILNSRVSLDTQNSIEFTQDFDESFRFLRHLQLK